MSLTERSEIVSGLYRVQSELGVLNVKCQDARALAIGVSVAAAQSLINEALDEFRPDNPSPAPLEFVTPKFP